jgi:predicted Zn-dependent peptidase
MNKVKQQQIKHQETHLKDNTYWLQILCGSWLNNDDIKIIPEFEERINKVTSKDIADFLQKYFDVEHYVRVNTFPEK